MTWRRALVLVLSAALLTTPARAGFIFKKKPKPEPTQRVPELLVLVKTSPDESKRADAAEELRKYDPQQFPEMITTLLDVADSDSKPKVRIEALATLTKYRPVSQEVGLALEKALEKDSSKRVWLEARRLLIQYHLAGYRSPKKDDKGPSLKEPPLAPPLEKITPPTAPQPLSPPASIGPPIINTRPTTVVPVKPVPLPMPVSSPSPMPAPPTSSSPQRMPVGPATPPAARPPASEGPSL